MTELTVSKHCSKIRDLIMPYLEDLLTAEERSELEEHVKHCRDCANELQEKKRWSSVLETNFAVMCPGSWELFDYARDPDREASPLKLHVQHCTACSEDVAAFGQGISERAMPEELWEKMTKASAIPRVIPKSHRSVREWIGSVVERIHDFFSAPALAFGTVAAVLLLVVILYPFGSSRPVAVMSSEPWRSVLIKRDLMSPVVPLPPQNSSQVKKKRLAELIIVKDLGGLPQQAWIDSLYREMEPSEKSAEIFDWVTPAEMSDALGGKQLNFNDRKAIGRELRAELDVTDVILITITSGKVDRTYDVNVEHVNTETGDILGEERLAGLTQENLGERTDRAIRSLLKVD